MPKHRFGKPNPRLQVDGRPVKIETETPRGPAGPVLVEASRDAEMICVGSVGIGRYARSILGSTATELAEKAQCPVAIIRAQRSQPPPDIDWIVVRMTDEPDNDVIVKYAAWEAKLRRAPMLVLGGRPEELTEHADGEFERRVLDWRRRHPEVRVYPITTKDNIVSFLRANDERVQLAVISASEAGQLAQSHWAFRTSTLPPPRMLGARRPRAVSDARVRVRQLASANGGSSLRQTKVQ